MNALKMIDCYKEPENDYERNNLLAALEMVKQGKWYWQYITQWSSGSTAWGFEGKTMKVPAILQIDRDAQLGAMPESHDYEYADHEREIENKGEWY